MLTRSERYSALSLMATATLVVVVLTLYLRHQLFGIGPFAIALQVVAALLMLWARLVMRGRSFHAGAAPTEGALVTSGPYHVIRHPIYSAILLFVWSGVLSHASTLSIALAALTTMFVMVRIVTEERLLTEHFQGYAAYAEHTKRLIPFVV